MPPYTPRPGTKLHKLMEAITSNPNASRQELAKMMGPGADISYYLSILSKNGIDVPPKIMHHQRCKNPTKPEYAKAVELLRNTILSAPEIEIMTGVKRATILKLNAANKCRSPIIGYAISSGKGLRIERIPSLHAKLPLEIKKRIIQSNRSDIERMVRMFPIEAEHAGLEKHVLDYVSTGLDNYSQELGSEKQIVLLLATRAIYDYKLKTISGINIPRLRAAREISYEQRAKEIEELAPLIRKYAKRRIKNIEDAEDVGQNSVLVCFYCLESFNPRLHVDLRAFARAITDYVLGKYYQEKTEERMRAAILMGEANVDRPHLQNKPKFTQHVGDKGKRFEK